MRGLIIISLCWAGLAQARELWIVGKGYVGHTDLKKPPTYFQDMEIASDGFDASLCRVWVSDETRGHLKQFGAAGLVDAVATSVRILSSVTNERFVTTAGSKWELRDRKGQVLSSKEAGWAGSSEQLELGWERAWSLNLEGNHLWLTHLDGAFTETKRTELSKTTEIWGYQKLTYDRAGDALWVGFTHTTATHIYSPTARRLSLEGDQKASFDWKERGLFFSSCLDGNHWLMARDIPSDSGFTVPVYSFLEKLGADGSKSTYYSGNTNDFIDATVCAPDAVYMIQRSIFGSDGSYLVRWDRTAGQLGEQLFRLPGPARALYLCDENG